MNPVLIDEIKRSRHCATEGPSPARKLWIVPVSPTAIAIRAAMRINQRKPSTQLNLKRRRDFWFVEVLVTCGEHKRKPRSLTGPGLSLSNFLDLLYGAYENRTLDVDVA